MLFPATAIDKKEFARKAVAALAHDVRGLVGPDPRVACNHIIGRDRASVLLVANRAGSDKTLVVWVFVPYDNPTNAKVELADGPDTTLFYDHDRLARWLSDAIVAHQNHAPIPAL